MSSPSAIWNDPLADKVFSRSNSYLSTPVVDRLQKILGDKEQTNCILYDMKIRTRLIGYIVQFPFYKWFLYWPSSMSVYLYLHYIPLVVNKSMWLPKLLYTIPYYFWWWRCQTEQTEWSGVVVAGWAEQQQQRTITIDHWEQWTPCWIDGLWIRKIANLNLSPTSSTFCLPFSSIPLFHSTMPSSCTFESRTTEAAVENRYCGPPPPQLGMILNGEGADRPTDRPSRGLIGWAHCT